MAENSYSSQDQEWARPRVQEAGPYQEHERPGDELGQEAGLSLSASMVRDPRMIMRGNHALRAAAMKAAQRTQGNRAVQRTIRRSVQREDSNGEGDGIWGSIKQAWNNEVNTEKEMSGEVKKGEESVNSGINWLESAESGLARSIASKAEGVPVLGSVANAGANWIDFASQVQGGILKGATGLVGGAVNMAANPIGTAQGLEAIAEHGSPVGILNPFKTIRQGYNVLSGNESLGDAANELFNPLQQMKENKDFSMAMANGVLQPYKESWNQGKYGEVVGRAGFDIGSLLLGAGEAKAGAEAGNLAKVAEVSDAVSGATKAAEVSDAAGALGKAAEGTEGLNTASKGLESGNLAPKSSLPIEPGPATQPRPVIEPGPATQPTPTIEPGPATQPSPAPGAPIEPGPATQPTPVIEPGPATQPTPTIEPGPATERSPVATITPDSGVPTVRQPMPDVVPNSAPPSQLVPDLPPQEIPPPAPSQPPPTIRTPDSQIPSAPAPSGIPAPESIPASPPVEAPPPSAPDVSVPPFESPKTSPAPSPEFLQNPQIPKPVEAPGWGERLLQEEADLGKKINETEWFWEEVEKLKR